MKLNHTTQYLEFLTADLPRIKDFYGRAFGRSFTDYGPNYTVLEGEYVDGGFTIGGPLLGSVLNILCSDRLNKMSRQILAAGGVFTQDVYDFRGGRRFELTAPHVNGPAVWT